MNKLVKLNDYRKDPGAGFRLAQRSMEGLIPVQNALKMGDQEKCLAKIAEYGMQSLYVQIIDSKPDSLLYMMEIEDGIWLNRKILEGGDISEQEIELRIDLIQMMENMNYPSIQRASAVPRQL